MVAGEIYNKRILFGVLNWGLGHATRSAVLIEQLVQQQNQVIIVSAGAALQYLKLRFPQLQTVGMPMREIVYPQHRHTWLKILLQQKNIRSNIELEKKTAALHIHGIDYLISDNCYGFFHHNVYSILVTHQLHIRAPFLQALAQKKIHRLLQPFHEIWIPDLEAEANLGGQLSHPVLPQKSCTYIGPLSVLQKDNQTQQVYQYCAIISGPEQQRTLFENSVIDFLVKQNMPSVLVRGTQMPLPAKLPGFIRVIDFCVSAELNQLVNQSQVVIGRTGYSTIMDLYQLQKPCMLVPTPGQTEQEYLYTRHFGKAKKTLSGILPKQILPVKG